MESWRNQIAALLTPLSDPTARVRAIAEADRLLIRIAEIDETADVSRWYKFCAQVAMASHRAHGSAWLSEARLAHILMLLLQAKGKSNVEANCLARNYVGCAQGFLRVQPDSSGNHVIVSVNRSNKWDQEPIPDQLKVVLELLEDQGSKWAPAHEIKILLRKRGITRDVSKILSDAKASGHDWEKWVERERKYYRLKESMTGS